VKAYPTPPGLANPQAGAALEEEARSEAMADPMPLLVQRSRSHDSQLSPILPFRLLEIERTAERFLPALAAPSPPPSLKSLTRSERNLARLFLAAEKARKSGKILRHSDRLNTANPRRALRHRHGG
jgi:hypothetical protein